MNTKKDINRRVQVIQAKKKRHKNNKKKGKTTGNGLQSTNSTAITTSTSTTTTAAGGAIGAVTTTTTTTNTINSIDDRNMFHTNAVNTNSEVDKIDNSVTNNANSILNSIQEINSILNKDVSFVPAPLQEEVNFFCYFCCFCP